MSDPFSIEFEIRWADLDPNGHVRHSVYFDLGAQARVAYLESVGFGVGRMHSVGVGPVLFEERARYQRELGTGESVTADVVLTGVSENRKHWSMRHHILKADGEVSCIIDCRGAWLDLRERRVVPAPDALAALLQDMPRAEDFQTL